MFRISQDLDQLVDVDTVDHLEPAVKSLGPGRYRVDEIAADPLPSGHTSRRWGIVIKRSDCTVEVEPGPWEPG